MGVKNGHIYPKREGPTSKPSSPRFGTFQGQNSSTLVYQTPFSNVCDPHMSFSYSKRTVSLVPQMFVKSCQLFLYPLWLIIFLSLFFIAHATILCRWHTSSLLFVLTTWNHYIYLWMEYYHRTYEYEKLHLFIQTSMPDTRLAGRRINIKLLWLQLWSLFDTTMLITSGTVST